MTSGLKEGFFNLANYPGDPISAGTRNIKTFFSETLPNMIYSNDRTLDLQKITGTMNVRNKNKESVLNNAWINKNESNGLSLKQAYCESVGNGDQFDHLSSLASSEDTQSRLRCGWVYNNTNPENGRGAYGNSEGPFISNATGTWTWNLDKAKEKFHNSICKNVQGCPDIDSSIYKQRCGWCTTSGKAIPIVNGKIAYPYNSNTACSPSQLVTKGSQCPAPPPISNPDPTAPRAPGEVCTPLANGALPRNCLLQKVIAAGCSDQGTLFQALRAGSDNDYTSSLSQQQAYTVYQERATMPLNSTGLRSGKITISDALNDFKKVQDQSTSGANDGLQFAARDLCLNKGVIDEFDFCAEIKDTDTAPFTLDCLQKAFLRSGGQKAGTSYPSQSTMSQWNSLSTWSGVKAKAQQILAATQSTDRKTQEEAMMMFYGIKMQNKRNALPYGPEIAWKDKNVVLSCDRPLPVPPGFTKVGCVSDDDNVMLDKWAAANGYTMGNPPQPSYTYKGCYNDCYQGRGLPNRLENVTSIEQCKAQAIAKGYNTFGNQFYGECWAGNNTDWYKMGKADNCPPLGGGCNQHIFSTQPTPPATPGISNVKVVMIESMGSASWLNFSQLVVLNQNGENISVRRSTSGSPEWGGAPTQKANDGDERVRNFPQNSHSAGGNAFWQVTLDSPQTVSAVVVYNRGDCCQDRLAGYRIALLDLNGSVLWRSGALSSDPKQVIRIV
jgi:hypothetical protein